MNGQLIPDFIFHFVKDTPLDLEGIVYDTVKTRKFAEAVIDSFGNVKSFSHEVEMVMIMIMMMTMVVTVVVTVVVEAAVVVTGPDYMSRVGPVSHAGVSLPGSRHIY